MTFRDLRATMGQTFSDWNDHDAPRLGAALAFYMILSLAPLAILTLALLAPIFGHSTTEEKILSQAQNVIGQDGAHAVRAMIAQHPLRATSRRCLVLSRFCLALLVSSSNCARR